MMAAISARSDSSRCLASSQIVAKRRTQIILAAGSRCAAADISAMIKGCTESSSDIARRFPIGEIEHATTIIIIVATGTSCLTITSAGCQKIPVGIARNTRSVCSCLESATAVNNDAALEVKLTRLETFSHRQHRSGCNPLSHVSALGRQRDGKGFSQFRFESHQCLQHFLIDQTSDLEIGHALTLRCLTVGDCG